MAELFGRISRRKLGRLEKEPSETTIDVVKDDRIDDGEAIKEPRAKILSLRTAELVKAHAEWSSEDPALRGKFNTGWLHTHGYAPLYAWANIRGGIELLAAKVGGEVAKDFKKVEIVQRTINSAVDELRKAHEQWLTSRKGEAFNVKWLKENDFDKLYKWAAAWDSIKALADLAGGQLEKDFQIKEQVKGRTVESAHQELEAAHAVWSALPADARGKFNYNWLQENGYSKICGWFNKRQMKLEDVINSIGGEIAEDFNKKQENEGRTIASARLELEAAYRVWEQQPEEIRGKFNVPWLRDNGFAPLYQWINKQRRKGVEVALIDGFLSENLQKRKIVYTNIELINAYQKAHKQWKSEPEETRGEFNAVWLNEHGYGDFHRAAHSRDIDNLLLKAGTEVAADFKKIQREEGRTLASSIAELETAYLHWNELALEDKPSFDRKWLVDNGHEKLIYWADRQQEGIYAMAREAGVPMGDPRHRIWFEGRTTWTPDLARDRLIAAYAAWKEIPEEGRPSFGPGWLIYNGFNNLYLWAHKYGGLPHLIQVVGGEVLTDFEAGKITFGLLVEELKKAHTAWKEIPEEGRPPFNTGWLQRNHYGNLYRKLHKNGGIDIFIEAAGLEVKRDFERVNQKGTLRDQVIKDAKEFAAGETIDALTFQKLLGLCGSSRGIDILYRFRPEYKKLPAEYVRSVLGDYLGDCLAVKRPFRFEDAAECSEFFSEPSLQVGLIEVLKLDCLQFYYRERRAASTRTDHDIVYAYLDRAVDMLGHLDNYQIDHAVQEVTSYFASIFEIQKPEYLVEALVAGRSFPDINQRINTKELAEKKRLLIADEMGLGKSASVIFAKENLGLGTALIVVPSNVIELGTWQKYLSDNGGGYFRRGFPPKVLVIHEPHDIARAATEKYDYIIVAQEKMNEGNMRDLNQMEFDMLIVDEVHKLKAPGGKRSDRLLKLANKVEGEGKYLALLSATPAPNRIEDLAVSLKLLYPDEYGELSSQALARQIVNAEDVLDLREHLLQRMQMKLLEDSVEMPPLEEKVEVIDLSPIEREIYNAVIEDDELEPTEKLHLLRLFLLNPHLFDPTPGLEGTKVVHLGNELQQEFQAHNKIVVFVNGYIEGVIRGEGNIINELGLDPSIQIFTIHGENRDERVGIQRQFTESEGKVLLLVSGQTSDVGVDFSVGESVHFYNEPWTEYDRKQQRSRVYRPGLLRALTTHTAIIGDTIEEGIHLHKEAKFQAVEKVLKGIPLSEIEKRILTADNDEDAPEADVNPELARFYFSVLQRLQKMFTYLKGIGEERFKTFLETYGKAYAEGYRAAGVRSYQANVNRFSAALFDHFVVERGQRPSEIRILDIPSGPEMLRRHSRSDYANSIVSVDMNAEHFVDVKGEIALGSFNAIPYPDESMDYLNCALGLHYTAYSPKYENYERIQALREMNRVLKVGGRVVINEMFSLEFRSQEKLSEAAKLLGFRLVKEYTGKAVVGQQYQSNVVTLEKVESCKRTPEEVHIDMIEADIQGGLKWKSDPKMKLKDSRKILTDYMLNGREVHCQLNDEDRAVLEEERSILQLGQALRDQHGGIVAIPAREVIENGFIRIRPNKKYILFKPLTAGNGAVIIREVA